MIGDPDNLRRFIVAQNQVYDDVVAELTRGCKESHWMWFIFPQFKGLGSSPLAVKFAIGSLREAENYLRNPILGPRLSECCDLLLQIEGRSIDQIMGYPDNLKLRSSVTLFSRATTENKIFLQVLAKYFNGQADLNTIEALSNSS